MIAEGLLDGITEELKGFVERQEVQEYAKEKAEQIAKYLAQRVSATDQEAQQIDDTIKHLKAQVKGEVSRLQLALVVEVEDTIVRIVRTAISVASKVLGGA
jgi:glutaredoxin 2